MKIFSSLVSVCIGFFFVAFYLPGSHGNIRFRPAMAEDWILGGDNTIVFFNAADFFYLLDEEQEKIISIMELEGFLFLAVKKDALFMIDKC